MGAFAVGSVVLVRFPFSDLTASKLRPAVIVATAHRDDWILCQITSNPFSDPDAITFTDEDFLSGSLMKISFARPAKLFCANAAIIEREIGILKKEKFLAVIQSVIGVFERSRMV